MRRKKNLRMEKWTQRDRKLSKRSTDKEFSKSFKKRSKDRKIDFKNEIKLKYT